MEGDRASPRLRLAHVVYGGLGGHGAVLLAMIDASDGRLVEHQVVFYGVEATRGQIIDAFRSAGHRYVVVQKGSVLDLRGMWRIARWLRNRRADVVLFHTSQSLLPVWLLRALSRSWHPCLIEVERHANHLKTRKDWILSFTSSWVADGIVFLTAEHQAACATGLGRLAGRARTATIPNGVNTTKFRPDPSRAPGATLVVGMESRMTAIKDHATLIRAIGQVRHDRPVRLELAGDGDTRAALEQLVAELDLGDVVTFRYTLDQPELIEMLQGLDIYVHATLGETMSNAILEAMATGLAIVASRVPGVDNLLVEGRTALLVPPRDPEALASAISALADDPARRRLLGTEARRVAEHEFGHARTWERYEQVVTAWRS